MRSKRNGAKLNDAHRKDTEDQKKGATYKSGIAMTQATKAAKNLLSDVARNPKGTLPKDYKCKYHHVEYCQVLGHKKSNNRSCYMFGRSAEERGKTEQRILQLTKDEYLLKNPMMRK